MSTTLWSFIDLEGVLVPEMWPHLAAEFDIDELRANTRDIADYRSLMNIRIAALARHGIALTDICIAVRKLAPFDGAQDFLAALRERGNVVIVSDSFRPMNEHFLDLLPVDSVLCHALRTDEAGLINGMVFWNDLRGKQLCFKAFDVQGCCTFAVGDALNDIAMLRAASRGVLFRASATTHLAAGDLPRADTYRAALAILDA